MERKESCILITGDSSLDMQLSEWLLDEAGCSPFRSDSSDLEDQLNGRHVEVVVFACDKLTVEKLEWIHTIRQSYKIPVLSIVPLPDDDSLELLCTMQVEEIIFKPLRSEELLHRLRRLRRAHRSHRKGVAKPIPKAERWSVETADHDQTRKRKPLACRKGGFVLYVDMRTKCVEIGDLKLHLTPKEFSLLSLLASDVGRVFSKEEIISEVWSGGRRYYANDVHQCVCQLRAKLKRDPSHPRWIKTISHFGYMLDAAVDEQ